MQKDRYQDDEYDNEAPKSTETVEYNQSQDGQHLLVIMVAASSDIQEVNCAQHPTTLGH